MDRLRAINIVLGSCSPHGFLVLCFFRASWLRVGASGEGLKVSVLARVPRDVRGRRRGRDNICEYPSGTRNIQVP